MSADALVLTSSVLGASHKNRTSRRFQVWVRALECGLGGRW